MNMFQSKSVSTRASRDLDGLAVRVIQALDDGMQGQLETPAQQSVRDVKATFLAYHESDEPDAYRELEMTAKASGSAITRTEMLPINEYLREKLGVDAYAPPDPFRESLMNDLQEIVRDPEVASVALEAFQAVKDLMDGINNWATDIKDDRIGAVSLKFSFLCTPERAWAEVRASILTTIEDLKLDYEFSSTVMSPETRGAIERIGRTMNSEQNSVDS